MYTDAGAIETCARHKEGKGEMRGKGQREGESTHNATAMCQNRNNKAPSLYNLLPTVSSYDCSSVAIFFPLTPSPPFSSAQPRMCFVYTNVIPFT